MQCANLGRLVLVFSGQDRPRDGTCDHHTTDVHHHLDRRTSVCHVQATGCQRKGQCCAQSGAGEHDHHQRRGDGDAATQGQGAIVAGGPEVVLGDEGACETANAQDNSEQGSDCHLLQHDPCAVRHCNPQVARYDLLDNLNDRLVTYVSAGADEHRQEQHNNDVLLQQALVSPQDHGGCTLQHHQAQQKGCAANALAENVLGVLWLERMPAVATARGHALQLLNLGRELVEAHRFVTDSLAELLGVARRQVYPPAHALEVARINGAITVGIYHLKLSLEPARAAQKLVETKVFLAHNAFEFAQIAWFQLQVRAQAKEVVIVERPIAVFVQDVERRPQPTQQGPLLSRCSATTRAVGSNAHLARRRQVVRLHGPCSLSYVDLVLRNEERPELEGAHEGGREGS
mmetsp:Transcript_110199/g.310798  ORF Transcript_110199/g.310798 Transcript_110199/m.310798 type:complete len:402 (+) Transcript_110199:100-1305(+)